MTPPSPAEDRQTPSVVRSGTRSADRADDRARVVAALTTPELAPIVDLVLWVEDVDGVMTAHAASHLGRVVLRPGAQHEVLAGVDPLPSEDAMAFLPYAAELADPSPGSSLDNAYPLAAERILSFFADPARSPDVAVVHTPRHFYPEQGGHVGEHGSLDVIQSRAPLVLSGAGIRRRGLVDEHARLVDVGPTLAALAGVPEADLHDAAGQPLDGRVLAAYLDGVRPRAVVGILWDGAHCSDLVHLAETGELPHVARLIARGTALRGGAVAQFPSITLTNHTSILTGVGPGRHGVLGNVFYDRETGERVVPNDASTWHRSSEWLRPGVRTVFEMVGDAVPSGAGARTASVDEAIDRGADYSTMQRIRASGNAAGAGGLNAELPDPRASPFVVDPAMLADASVSWAVQVDDLGLQQVLQLWAAPESAPRLTWWANIVTDAGHHAAGPRSEIARATMRQSDARLGVFLDRLEQQGVLDEVAIVLTADHGFEGSDPAVTGSWTAALDDLGLAYRDEGPGLVYLL
ncbi:alkaline phosphatase family protein [Lapillicoccus sp.]|uniref:alkaline phosphatase family protein n=1 Tax=Lapillicoccus sp. TaxID=1909287 RepID=UPI0025D362CB|nr:alkaline phosphatase family protein [Lapillicoccus sp.]